MDEAELQKTTQVIALRVVRVCEALPDDWRARALGRDLLRSGTSVGALARLAVRARTPAVKISRLEHVEDVVDETLYWLDLISLAGFLPPSRLKSLVAELEKIEQQVAEMIATRRPRRTPRAMKAAEAA